MATHVHAPKSPWALYRIAKRTGTWNPENILLTQDRAHYQSLTPGMREQFTKVCALFYEGEVSVADTLAWFLVGFTEPDRRAFLSTQIFEEVKHAEFFRRYFKEVLDNADTSHYLVPEYRGVLLDELDSRGRAIGAAALAGDPAGLERAMVLGVAHYMGIVEGLLAVSGYDYFDEMLSTRGLFPGLQEAIRQIRIDEGRHIVHGMDYLRQRIAGNPDYAAIIQQLFVEEGMKIPPRTDFAFNPNEFGLDQQRQQEIAYEHLAQRSCEIGLAACH